MTWEDFGIPALVSTVVTLLFQAVFKAEKKNINDRIDGMEKDFDEIKQGKSLSFEKVEKDIHDIRNKLSTYVGITEFKQDMRELRKDHQESLRDIKTELKGDIARMPGQIAEIIKNAIK